MDTKLKPHHTPALAGTETTDHALKLMLSIQQELKRANRQLFDKSNPVDEFVEIAATAANGVTTITTDYDSTEIYESILYCLPLGTTSAVMQFGTTRSIPLYSGAAIAVQQPVILPNLGIIVAGGDRRTLTVVGATNNGYIGFVGHLLGRELSDK